MTLKLLEEHPEISKLWSNKNTRKLEEVTIGMKYSCILECSRNHEWRATPRNLNNLKVIRCPECYKYSRKLIPGVNDLLTKIPEVVNTWDYIKNKYLLPEDFYYLSSEKVYWKCNNGHSWSSSIRFRFKSDTRENILDCPLCSKNNLLNEDNLFVNNASTKLLNEWDYEKNTIDIHNISQASAKKIWWLCEEFKHSWKAELRSRTVNGNNCPYCSHQLLLEGFNDFKSNQQKLSLEWNHKKNELLPNEVTVGNNMKVWWICSKGHSYEEFTKNRVNWLSDCPKCYNFKSKAELFIHKILEESNIESELNFPIIASNGSKLLVDLFLKDYNLIIEFDGDYWHKNKIEKDTYKSNLLLKSNYKLIRIREEDLVSLSNNIIVEDNNCYKEFFVNENRHEDLSNIMSEIIKIIESLE